MAKNRIEFSAPLLLLLAFVPLFISEPAGAGERVVLPESISIKVVLMSYFGNRGDVRVELKLAPSGYLFHSTRCSKDDKEIENREVEKFVEFIFTLGDHGKKATCCDHLWTEINLNYSSPPGHKKIMLGYDLLGLTEIFIPSCGSPWVAFNPEDPGSQRRLGQQLYKIGLYDRAAKALERAVKLNPEHVAVETHEALGDTYRMLRSYEKALEAYKRALGLRPESAELFLKLGSLYSESGRLPEAIEAYRQALHFAPTGDTARQAQASIGHLYKDQGRLADAAKAFEETDADGKDCARLYGDKGRVFDPETRWTYFADIVHEFVARPDGSAVVAFQLSARRYAIPKGADPAFSKAAEVSQRDGKAVHVAYEDGKNQVKRPGGGTMDGLPKVHWVDAKQQHPSCR